MTVGMLLWPAFLLQGAPATQPARFEFRDEETHAGRAMMQYRDIVLRPSPARDVTADAPFDDDSVYGLVLVGDLPEKALTVVWSKRESSAPQVWLDADGDGRLTRDERHVLTGERLEIRAVIPISRDADATGLGGTRVFPTAGTESGRYLRTLVLRRAALGDGLQYAVRGYRLGALTIGDAGGRGAGRAALLTDQNADGLFNTPGVDRIWIDLNDDGVFDGLSEQFPLGSPIAVAGQTYTVSVEATGEFVRATPRSTQRGALRVALREGEPMRLEKLQAGLVSDIGELVYLDSLDRPASLPVAVYRVASLSLTIKDTKGQTWTYSFSGRSKCDLRVEPGQEASTTLLAGLRLDADIVPPRAPPPFDQSFAVTPRLVASSGLYLTFCSTGDSREPLAGTRSAEIYLVSEGDDPRLAARSGFA